MLRKTLIPTILFISILFLGATNTHAQTPFLSFSPDIIFQGNPIFVQIDSAPISSIKKLTFNGKKLGVFMYKDKPTALIGIDLNKKPGASKLVVELTDGTILEKIIDVALRDKIETPLGIPEKLGGDTKASQDKLVATLNEDNKSLVGIRTNKKTLWTDTFIPPVEEIFVTSPYGNSRKTGVYSIPHKGVDYRAKIGTEIVAVNRGVVRIVKTFRNHGKTVVVDHGMGVMSFYLHLSKIKVKVGDIVERGKTIALSGDSGYTKGAHLHLGIRINETAIDPVKFFELFK